MTRPAPPVQPKKRISDKERLDFMGDNPGCIWHAFKPHFMGWGHYYMNEEDDGLPTIRAAIDAAIKIERAERARRES